MPARGVTDREGAMDQPHPNAALGDAPIRMIGRDELVELIRSLTPEECLEPGYQHDRDWTVRDIVAHLGCRLAEAEMQLERIGAGTYEGRDVDVDARNAVFLEAMSGQPWEVAWVQANAVRTLMVQDWCALTEPADDAARWIRKSGRDHYTEHLERLREWVIELISRREAGTSEPPG